VPVILGVEGMSHFVPVFGIHDKFRQFWGEQPPQASFDINWGLFLSRLTETWPSARGTAVIRVAK